MPDPSETLTRSLAERYRVEREIGRGGMATVYLAQDLKHGRQVAIKALDPDAGAVIGRERFLREIGIAARLNHPHVLALFDSGAAGDLLYYVMPYIEEGSLRARLGRDGGLPVAEAVRLTTEIASALRHAHQHGIVHRDLKPENVLLAGGIALLSDFGIARATASDPGDDTTQVRTRAGLVLGTPRYMSPEQASGGVVDERTDIYALGCVLFEMLTGRPLFEAPTADQMLRMHMTREAPDVTRLRPAVPHGVAAAVARALAKSPEDRFATAAQFAEALASPSGGGTVPTIVRAQQTTPNNLPAQRTRFIGRDKEIAECARLLAQGTRLMTLTGIGGCGKTRLALRVAERQLESCPDGVWFVDLAPLMDEDRLTETVAQPAGVKEAAGKDLLESLVQHLAGKSMLLVLDNCDHLIAPCARLADRLLGAAEHLKILATSREGLGIEGERLFALRSLDVPREGASTDARAVEECEAVRLFVDRAQLVLPDFAITPRNAAAVAEICRRLDGIPLAIELAAARVKILSVDQIRDRLDDRFRLLTGGSKALPRHQTLLATIQWSYDQLAADEQRLLRRLCVFVGGWTLDLATRLCGEGADEFEVMDLLTRLVDKSLVHVERDDSGGVQRYAMLETVRQYGQDRLLEEGESGEARQRHLAEFIALAERAYPERFHRDELWAEALEAEHGNLSAALDAARGTDPEAYLQLSGALAWFFQARSHFVAGREHLTAALDATSEEPPRPARARALWGIANTLAWMGDGEKALPRMEEALGIWRSLGDLGEVAIALEGIGWARLLAGNEEIACETFRECLRLQREGGDPVMVNRAMVALAQVLVALHQVDEARPMSREIVAFSQPRGDRRNEHFGWHFLADCALIEGKCDESLPLYRRSLALARAIGDRLEMSFEVQGVAMSLAGLSDPEQALRLAASARAEWQRIGTDLNLRFWEALMERYLGRARAALGDDTADRISREGALIPFGAAIEMALAGWKEDPPTPLSTRG